MKSQSRYSTDQELGGVSGDPMASKRTTHVSGPLPGPKGAYLLEHWHMFEADVTGFQPPVVWESASGCRVTDVDANVYIDWTSGVLVTNVGHCHPKLVTAIQNAAANLLNNYENCHPWRVDAARKLVAALPPHLNRCFFLNTGSEAMEAAARLAKRYTGNYELITFHGAFHGRTSSSAAMGGLPGPKRGFGPGVPGVIRMPYPNPYRDPLRWCDAGDNFSTYFNYLDETVAANSEGKLAAVAVETYQGTSGFVFPPGGWLQRLEKWTRQRGLLFIVDEVQASFGRTGKMWGFEHEDVLPDIVALGKGIGSGISVSAVAAREEIFSCLNKGELGSTYGGNPLACAAVSSVLEIMEAENLPAHAAYMGAIMNERLKIIAEKLDHIGDIRSRGLVGGMEFVKTRESKEPFPEMARRFVLEAANRGLLFGAVGQHGNIIRLAPPLVISPDEMNESLSIIESVLESLR
jgi:4-aminobutyrate aminotransferase-like enzyme